MHNIKAIDSNLVSRISTISVQSPAFQELAIKAASMSVLSPGIQELATKAASMSMLSQGVQELATKAASMSMLSLGVQELATKATSMSMLSPGVQELATKAASMSMLSPAVQEYANKIFSLSSHLLDKQEYYSLLSSSSMQLSAMQGISNMLPAINTNSIFVQNPHLIDTIAALSVIHDYRNSLNIISADYSCRKFLFEEKPFASSFVNLKQYQAVLNPTLLDEYVIFLNKVQEAFTLSQAIIEALCDDIEENRNIIAKNKFIDVFYKYTINISEKTRKLLSDKDRVSKILEMSSIFIALASKYSLFAVDSETMSVVQDIVDFITLALILRNL